MNGKQKPKKGEDTKSRAKSKPAKKKKEVKKEDADEAADVVNELPQVQAAKQMTKEDSDMIDKALFEKIVEL